MSDPQRILVRAPNWVGDLVMATPALRALRAAYPTAEITVEARPYLRELVEPLPSVDGFVPCGGSRLAELRLRVRGLKAACFDWALVMPDSVSAVLGPFFARIPRRVGYTRDLLRRSLCTEWLAQPTENGVRVPISMIERYLAITRHVGCPDQGDAMEVPVTAAARQAVAARLAASGLGEERLLLAVPGASYGSSKLWPPEHFAAACDEIAHAHGLRTVLAPGPGEEAVASSLLEHARTGGTLFTDPVLSLGELAALTARATLVLSNDTGPRQIAVAFGIPTVVLMGPTDPRYTQHHLDLQRVLREPVECSPCGKKRCPIDHRCMTRLAPARAARAADELLQIA